MNQLKKYRELVDNQKKVVELVERYRNLGFHKYADRYVALGWMLEADIQRIKNDVLTVNK